MIGSGGMARSHVESFLLAKDQKDQVYSPTKLTGCLCERNLGEYGLEVKT
jgi:hypothetical protein